MAYNLHEFKLTIPQLTNWESYITRATESSKNALYRCQDNKIGRIYTVGGQARYVEVSPSADKQTWDVAVQDGSPADEVELSKLLRHVFSLDTDIDAFYAHCADKPGLAAPIKHLQGARPLCDPDVFSSAISTILGQQINLEFAGVLKKRLWALTGAAVMVDGDIHYADPLPEAVAKLDYSDLRELQITTRKSEYIIDFARSVVSGEFDIAALEDKDDAAAMAQLCSVRGFGPWTAECILLFGLGRPDLLPVKDVGLQRSLTISLGLPERISEKELRKVAKSWSPWRSWATYYLWMALRLPDGWEKIE